MSSGDNFAFTPIYNAGLFKHILKLTCSCANILVFKGTTNFAQLSWQNNSKFCSAKSLYVVFPIIAHPTREKFWRKAHGQPADISLHFQSTSHDSMDCQYQCLIKWCWRGPENVHVCLMIARNCHGRHIESGWAICQWLIDCILNFLPVLRWASQTSSIVGSVGHHYGLYVLLEED